MLGWAISHPQDWYNMEKTNMSEKNSLALRSLFVICTSPLVEVSFLENSYSKKKVTRVIYL
jgi:hypothetical protein